VVGTPPWVQNSLLGGELKLARIGSQSPVRAGSRSGYSPTDVHHWIEASAELLDPLSHVA
jgi:hypothetical protein